MKRLWAWMVVSVVLAGCPLIARSADAPKRPHIVMLIADDMSITDSSAYGKTEIPTPNMTALSKEGMTFDPAYATSPSCAPIRAAPLNGCHNVRNGRMFNHQPIKPDIKRWPAYFQALGYEVVAIGKVGHCGQVRTYGFDYAAAVARADSDLGLVREAVKKNLPADNTVFVFSADQGSQWPFAKWNLYDAGLHMPLIVMWPGHVTPGRRAGAMVSWLDIMPTLPEAAGADPKTAAPDVDGKAFMTVLTGATDVHRDRVFSTHSGDGNINFYPSRAVRMGSNTHIDLKPQDTNYWPLWVELAKTDPKVAAWIQTYTHRPPEEMYDLASDPDELKNLAADASHKDDVEKLRDAMDEWMKAGHDEDIATDKAVRLKREGKQNDGLMWPTPRSATPLAAGSAPFSWVKNVSRPATRFSKNFKTSGAKT